VIGNPLGKSGGSFIQQILIILLGSLSASTPYLAGIIFIIVSGNDAIATRLYSILEALRIIACVLMFYFVPMSSHQPGSTRQGVSTRNSRLPWRRAVTRRSSLAENPLFIITLLPVTLLPVGRIGRDMSAVADALSQ